MTPTIAILHDAAAMERADTSDVLVEARYIADTLRDLGFEPVILPVSLDFAALTGTLRDLAPYAVVNLVEAVAGHAALIHWVPALLDVLRVPFTGCSAQAQWLTSNKRLAKQQLLAAGVPVPAFGSADSPNADGPWIVKSVWEHASLGLDDQSIIADPAALPDAIASRQRRWGGDWFAERFIPGREFNAAILTTDRGPQVLPIAEIRFHDYPPDKPHIVGYAAKWQPDSFEYRNTQRSFAVETDLQRQLAVLALRCWDWFGLSGYARVDFRVAADGSVWVLEVNANPCLSPDAGFAAMLAQAGIDFGTALHGLLNGARRRAGLPG